MLVCFFSVWFILSLLTGFCGHIAPGNIAPANISGPFVGKLVAVFHQVTPNHSWTVAPRENAPLPTFSTSQAAALLPHARPRPRRPRPRRYYVSQWRRVPKAVSKALKSLTYSWPRHTEVYPTRETGRQKNKHTTTTTKGPPTKRTKAPRLQTINERQQTSYPPDQSHDDELSNGDDGATRDPPAPEYIDPDPDQLEENDLVVYQIEDSDEEIPNEN